MNTKTVICLIVLGVALSANLNQNDQVYSMFQKFVQSNGVSFSTNSDLEQKYSIYKENYLAITSANTPFQQAINQFALLTPGQFKDQMLTFDPSNVNLGEGWPVIGEKSSSTNNNDTQTETLEEPDVNLLGNTVDLRTQNRVTSVRDQGSCGCCWAFSAIAAIEGAYAKKYGTLNSFSEQQLLSCDNSNSGCNGGIMGKAMDYAKKNGLSLLKDYPYAGKKGTCSAKNSSSYRVANYKSVNGENAIATSLANGVPVAVAIDASNLQFYSSGLAYCKGTPSLNHGVTVVGSGNDKSGNYWIVKNSWGTRWGMSGYFYLAKGNCGIGQYGVAAEF